MLLSPPKWVFFWFVHLYTKIHMYTNTRWFPTEVLFPFNISVDFLENNSFILNKIMHDEGSDINECVQFGADPSRNPNLVHLTVVWWGACWALAEWCSAILKAIPVSRVIKHHNTCSMLGNRSVGWSILRLCNQANCFPCFRSLC